MALLIEVDVSQLDVVTDGERFRFEIVQAPGRFWRRDLPVGMGVAAAVVGLFLCIPLAVSAARRHVV